MQNILSDICGIREHSHFQITHFLFNYNLLNLVLYLFIYYFLISLSTPWNIHYTIVPCFSSSSNCLNVWFHVILAHHLSIFSYQLKEFILNEPEAYEIKIRDQVFRKPGGPTLEEVIEKLQSKKETSQYVEHPKEELFSGISLHATSDTLIITLGHCTL